MRSSLGSMTNSSQRYERPVLFEKNRAASTIVRQHPSTSSVSIVNATNDLLQDSSVAYVECHNFRIHLAIVAIRISQVDFVFAEFIPYLCCKRQIRLD